MKRRGKRKRRERWAKSAYDRVVKEFDVLPEMEGMLMSRLYSACDHELSAVEVTRNGYWLRIRQAELVAERVRQQFVRL